MGANKEFLRLKKWLPVENPLHWIKEFKYFFCSPLNETPENGPCWLNGVLPNDSNLYL